MMGYDGEKMGGETVGTESVEEMDRAVVPENADVRQDQMEIIKIKVSISGQEFYRYAFADSDWPGFEALCSDIDSGNVDEQYIYSTMAQEWLNRQYGMLPRKSGFVRTSDIIQ